MSSPADWMLAPTAKPHESSPIGKLSTSAGGMLPLKKSQDQEPWSAFVPVGQVSSLKKPPIFGSAKSGP